jgi:hypothetical protein
MLRLCARSLICMQMRKRDLRICMLRFVCVRVLSNLSGNDALTQHR